MLASSTFTAVFLGLSLRHSRSRILARKLNLLKQSHAVPPPLSSSASPSATLPRIVPRHTRSMGKNQVYVVFVGRNPGIYHSWMECSTQVNGYSSALYKSFKTYAEAYAALRTYYGWKNPVLEPESFPPICNHGPGSSALLAPSPQGVICQQPEHADVAVTQVN